MNKRKIGIMGAMPEEIGGIIPLLENSTFKKLGQRTYISGQIEGIDTVLVFSRWGKVAAAATVTALVHEFGITELFFTGVAGGINPKLNIGDVVIAQRLIQHDMDARPLMKQFEVPLLSKTFFETDSVRTAIACNAVREILQENHLSALVGNLELMEFNIKEPKLYTGDIASGDQFFSDQQQKEKLSIVLPSILCVEMEGAAVAQVCYEYDIPFCIIRTISDTADEKSHVDFVAFIKKISSCYSTQIIRNIYRSLNQEKLNS